MRHSEASVEKVDIAAYTIPTDAPEGDGTLRWDSTTMIVCEIHAAGQVGLGYTYGDKATASVCDAIATKSLIGRCALDILGIHTTIVEQVRNDGSRGIASMAISALDVALWDLKAKLLGLPLIDLFGAAQSGVAAYGSGGFTTYDNRQLVSQLSGWVAEDLKSVKMKIGAEPAADVDRVRVAREAIGANANLFVDANGAFDARNAIGFAEKITEFNVTWIRRACQLRSTRRPSPRPRSSSERHGNCRRRVRV